MLLSSKALRYKSGAVALTLTTNYKKRSIMRALACLALASLLLSVRAAGAQPSAPHTLYAAGDIAFCVLNNPEWSFAASTARLVGDALSNDPNGAVITLGDNVYPRGTAREFDSCYDPTWGRFKGRTWPAPGNHEYYTPNAAPYFAYFGPRAGPGYYSVQLGSWHVISLTLAVWHHPLYSSGDAGSYPVMQQAWELLYQAGAALVLSGHDHDYERFGPQDALGNRDDNRGVRQFVVGTGGGSPRWFRASSLPNSEFRDSSRYGVLRLVLHADGYEWEFLAARHTGLPGPDLPDRGSGSCH
jgi:hypothetical protein